MGSSPSPAICVPVPASATQSGRPCWVSSFSRAGGGTIPVSCPVSPCSEMIELSQSVRSSSPGICPVSFGAIDCTQSGRSAGIISSSSGSGWDAITSSALRSDGIQPASFIHSGIKSSFPGSIPSCVSPDGASCEIPALSAEIVEDAVASGLRVFSQSGSTSSVFSSHSTPRLRVHSGDCASSMADSQVNCSTITAWSGTWSLVRAVGDMKAA